MLCVSLVRTGGGWGEGSGDGRLNCRHLSANKTIKDRVKSARHDHIKLERKRRQTRELSEVTH